MPTLLVIVSTFCCEPSPLSIACLHLVNCLTAKFDKSLFINYSDINRAPRALPGDYPHTQFVMIYANLYSNCTTHIQLYVSS